MPQPSIIKTFEAKLKAAGKPGYADVKQYEHYPEAYQDLLNKRIDAVVNSKSTMLVVMKDAPGKFKMIGGVSDITAYFGMAFRKEDVAFQSFVNEQLAAHEEGRHAGEAAGEVVRLHDGNAECGARRPALTPRLHARFRLGGYLVRGALHAAGRRRHTGDLILRADRRHR